MPSLRNEVGVCAPLGNASAEMGDPLLAAYGSSGGPCGGSVGCTVSAVSDLGGEGTGEDQISRRTSTDGRIGLSPGLGEAPVNEPGLGEVSVNDDLDLVTDVVHGTGNSDVRACKHCETGGMSTEPSLAAARGEEPHGRDDTSARQPGAGRSAGCIVIAPNGSHPIPPEGAPTVLESKDIMCAEWTRLREHGPGTDAAMRAFCDLQRQMVSHAAEKGVLVIVPVICEELVVAASEMGVDVVAFAAADGEESTGEPVMEVFLDGAIKYAPMQEVHSRMKTLWEKHQLPVLDSWDSVFDRCMGATPTAPETEGNSAPLKEKDPTTPRQERKRKVKTPTTATKPSYDSKLWEAWQQRQKLKCQLELVRYELELLCAADKEDLSRIEDASLELDRLESGHVLRPMTTSGFSKPRGPSVVGKDRSLRDPGRRVTRLEGLATRLTNLAKKSDEALWELYAQSLDEQANADDALSTFAPRPQPMTNPHCPGRSDAPLDSMLPVGSVAQRGMLYINTDESTLKLLTEGEPPPDDIKTVPFFLERKVGQSRYQSLSARLVLGHEGGTDQEQDVVVDTGAAHSGIDQASLQRLYPELASQMEPVEGLRFVDASDREMPLAGKVRMKVCLKKRSYWTEFFVFKKLGVPFLLGVGSLVDGDLVIYPRGGTMYPHGNESAAVALKGAGAPHPFLFVQSCRCMPLARSDKGCAGGQWHHCSEAPPLEDSKPEPLSCSISSGVLQFSCGGESETVPANPNAAEPCIPESDPLGGRVPLRLAYDVHVPAGSVELPGRATLKLEYTEWVHGPDQGILIEPLGELFDSKSCHAYSVRHSTFDAHAMLPVLNHASSMQYFAKGTIVAYGTPGTGCTSVIGEPLAEGVKAPPRIMLAAEIESYEEQALKPFCEGGPPVTEEDFQQLGLDLSGSIHPGLPKLASGHYPSLPEEIKARIRAIASRWWLAWSRDDRAPRISRLVVIDIPTGDAKPIASKPYPIPQKYLDAVRKEMQKLLDAGLVEPGISDWASPTLLTVKKDSTRDELKVKVVVDYRKLNEVTIPDTGGLGNQEEILNSFGSGQRYAGIMDIAGGFYQFALSERDRHKSAFVLPSAMGGTSFIWRVAPYGLCRNPASYSRGMMFALQGLSDVPLNPLGQSRGGSHSWIDDVTCHADSMEGFLDQFERILQRLCHCGLSLKASKCHLLHERLEVLGYYVTPDGLEMQGKKIEAIKRMPPPSNVDEARVYLGAVNFYRRFIPHIGMLARPIVDILRKNGHWDQESVDKAVEAVNSFLVSDNVLSAPDFTDPNAEFVICPDACDVALGGVLLQWQHPQRPGPGPPDGVPLRGEKGLDPITQSWRERAGWKLRTIAYYSKTLDSAQRNWPVFDKEGGAVLMCLRNWADIVTACPTTVYTDSSVAASMLTKYKGTARLQRWGMELMSQLPYLKIAYRRGVDNGMGDLLSRFPLFEKYMPDPGHVVTVPDDELYDKIGEVVLSPPGRIHARLHVCPSGVRLRLKPRTDYYELWESRKSEELQSIWQEGDCPLPSEAIADQSLPSAVLLSANPELMNQRVGCFLASLENTPFFSEQRAFEERMQCYELYAQTYVKTMGAGPVVYDLYCGEGGFSRGARSMGAQCYGFDSEPRCKHAYENDPVDHRGQRTYAPSGMVFTCCDVESERFWEELQSRGRIGDLPPPDIIHASPPCSLYSKVRKLRSDVPAATPYALGNLDRVLVRLRTLESRTPRPLLWQVENVPESLSYVQTDVNTVVLCGTNMGHRVFRHRIFFCSYDVVNDLPHDHRGKVVGRRGTGHRLVLDEYPDESNMFGVYSRRHEGRGSYDEWHGALGAIPGTYTRKGICGVLPLGYGRYLTGQMVATLLSRQLGMPFWQPKDAGTQELEMLRVWAREGYENTARVSMARRRSPRLQADTVSDVGDNGRAADEQNAWNTTVDGLALVPSVTNLDPPGTEVEGVVGTTPSPSNFDSSSLEGVAVPDGSLGERPPELSVFNISPEEQLSDPTVAQLVHELGRPGSTALRSGLWEIGGNGLLYRRSIDSLGDPSLRLVLPEPFRHDVMHHHHYTLNPGHRSKALYPTLARLFYWSNMEADCLAFVGKCKICGARKRVQDNPVPPGAAPTPSRPWEVVQIDHKGPLKKSGGYQYILIAVCALTRYTVYIPVEDRTAATTFRALVNRVFSVFGPPRALISDNAKEFRGDLAAEMANYLGYRKVHVLPWRPGANGLAEAAVKRIKLLLERHTKRFSDWHKILPLAQYALNVSPHFGLGGAKGLSAYALLFGREPLSVPELENNDLGAGAIATSGFVHDLASRMKILHDQLRQESDAIKQRRSASAASQRPAYVPNVGDLVWLRYGNASNVRRLRSAGEAWQHPHLVEALGPYGAKLRPTAGARATLDWQPLHNISPAPPTFNDDTPVYPIDEYGTSYAPGREKEPQLVAADPFNPLSHLEAVGPPPNDDGTYDIESIGEAKKVGRQWHVSVKWLGYAEPTDETRSWMHSNCTDPDILRDIELSINRARIAPGPPQFEYGELQDSESESDSDQSADDEPHQTLSLQVDPSHSTCPDDGQDVPSLLRVYLVQQLRAFRSMN